MQFLAESVNKFIFAVVSATYEHIFTDIIARYLENLLKKIPDETNINSDNKSEWTFLAYTYLKKKKKKIHRGFVTNCCEIGT